jgi:hypothetical protein
MRTPLHPDHLRSIVTLRTSQHGGKYAAAMCDTMIFKHPRPAAKSGQVDGTVPGRYPDR